MLTDEFPARDPSQGCTPPPGAVRDDADLAGGFAVAARLAHDPSGVVHNAVGISLKHAGRRDPAASRNVLDTHAATMPGSALRLAIEKLEPDERKGRASTLDQLRNNVS